MFIRFARYVTAFALSRIVFWWQSETRAETNCFALKRCISKVLGKMLLLCQRLEPLNGMANCPGYHGYERV